MKERMARTWAERAQAELGASRRFRELLLRLKKFNTHPQILRRVEQAEQEEDLHAFWCSKMALHLGHNSGFATPKGRTSPLSFGWSELRERDRLLLDVVLMGCITESLNASLLNILYSHSDQSDARQLLHRILKDEVKHAQIGWAYLSQECNVRDCGFVSTYLVEMVEVSIHDELFLAVTDPIAEESYTYGVMPQHARLEQFKTTLDQVVCCGFEHFGIDASLLREWLNSKSEHSP